MDDLDSVHEREYKRRKKIDGENSVLEDDDYIPAVNLQGRQATIGTQR